jgi:hypothetical protein
MLDPLRDISVCHKWPQSGSSLAPSRKTFFSEAFHMLPGGSDHGIAVDFHFAPIHTARFR